VHDRIPAKTAVKGAAPAGIEADMVNTEEAASVVVHIDEMIGERRLLFEVYKKTISGMMNLTVFPITDTGDMA
jgi:hypothetical protein